MKSHIEPESSPPMSYSVGVPTEVRIKHLENQVIFLWALVVLTSVIQSIHLLFG